MGKFLSSLKGKSKHTPFLESEDTQRSSDMPQRSSLDTLYIEDSSTAPTLLPSEENLSCYKDSCLLPIYGTRFRSGIHVYESDLAAKVSKTITRQRKQPKGSNDTLLPPSLCCYTQSTYNPFSFSNKVPYMKIFRQGKTLRSASNGQPKSLLASQVLQRNIELGLEPNTQSIDIEDPGTTPFCLVWQNVLSNHQVKYVLEFDNALDYAQPSVTLINDGIMRTTRTSYDGIHMEWYGTTGLASPFGSSYFKLQICDDENPLVRKQKRPPIAIYNNAGSKTLAVTRKLGEFVIWEPGFEFADIIVAMGLVLREQEQRKEVEGNGMVYNKLANF